MSEVRRRRGLYSALAYLPVVVPPVVAVLLWQFFYDARPDGRVQHHPRLGRHRPAAVAPELGARRCRRSSSRRPGRRPGHRDHLSRGAGRASRRSCTTRPRSTARRSGSKIWHVTLPQLRAVLLVTLILQLIAHRAGVHRAVPVHRRRAGQRDPDRPAAIYHYAFQNSLGGDYGMAAALSLMLAAFLAVFTAVYFRLTRSWSELT